MSAYEDKALAESALATANAAIPKAADLLTTAAPGVGYTGARQIVAGAGASIDTATPGQFKLGSLATSWNLYGAYAAMPAAGTAGRVYYCTDAPAFVDSGTAWLMLPPGSKIGIPRAGVAADYTWLNQGTATATNVTGSIVELDGPSVASNSHRVLYRALANAAGVYRVRIAARLCVATGSSAVSVGLMLLAPAGGSNWNWVTADFTQGADLVYGYVSKYGTWNGVTMTISGSYANNLAVAGTSTYEYPQYWRGSKPLWFEWYCNGATRYFSISDDGFVWRTVASQAATLNLGAVPTAWGVFVNPLSVARVTLYGAYTATA